MNVNSLYFTGENRYGKRDVLLEVCFMLDENYDNVFTCFIVIENDKMFKGIKKIRQTQFTATSVHLSKRSKTQFNHKEKEEIFKVLSANPQIKEIIKQKVWNLEMNIFNIKAPLEASKQASMGINLDSVRFETNISKYGFKLELFEKKKKPYLGQIDFDANDTRFQNDVKFLNKDILELELHKVGILIGKFKNRLYKKTRTKFLFV